MPRALRFMQVASWPRENAADVRLPRDACNVFRDYCSRSMYQVGAEGWVGELFAAGACKG